MANKDFVPYNLALRLKEKGFITTEPFAMYQLDDVDTIYPLYTSDPYYYGFDDFNEYAFIAPTISQVLKWLRKEKKLHISINVWGRTWGYDTIELTGGRSLHWTAYCEDIKSYEDAALAGIEYVLDNLI